MKKVLYILILFAVSSITEAGISTVGGAKITHIEFYGNQFTVHLDQPHNSAGCGHPSNKVIALSTANEPGKTHYSALLAIWMSGKKVNMRLTDDTCNGDRPTLLNWSAE